VHIFIYHKLPITSGAVMIKFREVRYLSVSIELEPEEVYASRPAGLSLSSSAAGALTVRFADTNRWAAAFRYGKNIGVSSD
jgi:hypothetical protein